MNNSEPPIKLTRIDRHILSILQRDGRITYSELAKQVGLTTTPCIERVKKMEKAGIIQGYSARLNPNLLDATLMVYVEISLDHTSQNTFKEFSDAVRKLPEVLECHLVSGNFDYLIKARVADMNAFRQLLGETLLDLPAVQDSTSYVVMEEVKESMALNIVV